ncbi:MAG: anthranilate synthase component I [Endomicrobia bacterium]|nr:anthranilate synthase component I [Endomicrobiia bacterium]MCX7941296.1 anthranilate synthase component I [Endomicrobiia bacterium]MDW8055942.1 anthranilate synthase component I [Elusimicrobiota bacterium]
MNLDIKKFRSVVSKSVVSGKKVIIPLYDEIIVDSETPVSVFLKLAVREKFAYLLESAETNIQWGRYSFISIDPYIIFVAKNGNIEIKINNIARKFKGETFKHLRSLINSLVIPKEVCLWRNLPRFFGGFVGYFGYENVHLVESTVPRPKVDNFRDIPDVYLMFNRTVLIFDHYLNKLKILRLVTIDDKRTVDKLYLEEVSAIEKIKQVIRTTVALTQEINFTFSQADVDDYSCNISKEQFLKKLRYAKEYIHNGDVIQVVLSRRLYKRTIAEPFNIYRALRIINPSPYMFYLKFDNMSLIGSSPEILVRKEVDVVETRPIAGTRPRGSSEEQDSQYERQLLNSKKENAEHIMLVDLARNDIGRISKFGTITLPQLRIIEKYSHVMHLVSSVKGILSKNKDSIDVLSSCFPAGTVSGAPKVRAMQIISELEGETRGPYAGAVGYFSLAGNMDMAITIRTILYKNGWVYIQTGAGVVADSNPEKEFQETVNKAKALILAVKVAESVKG